MQAPACRRLWCVCCSPAAAISCSKVGKAYFALLDMLCHNHAGVIATRDTGAHVTAPGCSAPCSASLPATAMAALPRRHRCPPLPLPLCHVPCCPPCAPCSNLWLPADQPGRGAQVAGCQHLLAGAPWLPLKTFGSSPMSSPSPWSGPFGAQRRGRGSAQRLRGPSRCLRRSPRRHPSRSLFSFFPSCLQCAAAVDNLVGYYFKHQPGSEAPTPAAAVSARRLAALGRGAQRPSPCAKASLMPPRLPPWFRRQ